MCYWAIGLFIFILLLLLLLLFQYYPFSSLPLKNILIVGLHSIGMYIFRYGCPHLKKKKVFLREERTGVFWVFYIQYPTSGFTYSTYACRRCRKNDERPAGKNTTIWMERQWNLKVKVIPILILTEIFPSVHETWYLKTLILKVMFFCPSTQL